MTTNYPPDDRNTGPGGSNVPPNRGDTAWGCLWWWWILILIIIIFIWWGAWGWNGSGGWWRNRNAPPVPTAPAPTAPAPTNNGGATPTTNRAPPATQ